ncbi:M23 family metallopeptidase [Sphingomonas sp. M1-B02]|uniref:M23 family metallopeptidase n=1 Tax=Sphingomonas sp. M1-B02 TaxID=3114300 RepID=UPI00223FE497|nr:M23 family metallopeptidase [Sphingomonas sp. S6-11]UZK66783.1 M23 family metallopeptidase [Sphingomonas sp. S6-11]
MARRATIGLGAVLLLLLIAVASMVRIVPASAPVAAPVPQPATPMTRANEGNSFSHALLTVPVQGVPRGQIVDTWGQSRDAGARQHQATDIMAAGGTPVIAAAPGTVEKLFDSKGVGGISVYVRSPDRLWSYYYAHLQGYAPGLVEGMQVRPGDLLGYVGDTGNSGTGNFHLHFGVSRMRPEERWHQGRPVNPYPLLAGSAPRG